MKYNIIFFYKKMITIKYDGKEYDVTNFIKAHPGGNIIKEYNGMDIKKVFDKIGHSKHALHILEGLPSTDNQRNRNEHNHYSKSTILTKLNTHEDPYNIHKIAGVVSLFGFVITLTESLKRIFIDNYVNTVFNQPSIFNITLLVANVILILSSLQFEVSKKKSVYPGQKGLFENSEKRLHSIIFSMRSLCGIVIVWTLPNPKWKLILLIYVTHFAADCVTSYYEGSDASTIQSNFTKNIFRKVGINFASLSQLAAITMVSGFGPSAFRCDNMFLILMSIQVSVFFDTLVKKNIMNGGYVGISYIFLLLVTLLQLQYNNTELALWLVFGILRMYFRVNKYILYALILPLDSMEWVNNSGWLTCLIMSSIFLFCIFLAHTRNKVRYLQCFLAEDFIWETVFTTDIRKISRNTLRVRWELGIEYVNKLPLGKHLYFRFPGDNTHIRPFSPICNKSESFETIIKVYPGSKIGTVLWEAFINKKQIIMEASGPHGSLLINNIRTSTDSINRFNYNVQKVLFVCAGTGIVPCLPVIAFYSSKNIECHVIHYGDIELRKLVLGSSNIHVFDIKFVHLNSIDWQYQLSFVCGPKKFEESVTTIDKYKNSIIF